MLQRTYTETWGRVPDGVKFPDDYREHIDSIEFYDPDLTLKGLQICWQRARASR
jgi:hypothetical protein